MSDINGNINSRNFFTDAIDHLHNFLLLFLSLVTPQKDVIKQRPLICVYNQRYVTKFRSDLAECDWISKFENKSPNEKCNIFISTYGESCESSFPKETLRQANKR